MAPSISIFVIKGEAVSMAARGMTTNGTTTGQGGTGIDPAVSQAGKEMTLSPPRFLPPLKQVPKTPQSSLHFEIYSVTDPCCKSCGSIAQISTKCSHAT